MKKGTKDGSVKLVIEQFSEDHSGSVAGVISGRSLLDEIAQNGARKMLQAALEAEVEEFLVEHSARRDQAGNRLVVRNVSGGLA